MITSSQISKYGVAYTCNHTCCRDSLWTGNEFDPILSAHSDASNFCEGKPYALSVAIGPDNLCVVQIIVFKDDFGYFLYMNDESVTIFEQKEI